MPYAGSQAQSGRGTQLSIGETPTLIGELADFPFDRGEWQTVDTTNFESGLDAETLPTIRNTSDITLKGNRVSSDAGQVLLEAAYQSGVIQAFTATLPKTAEQTTSGDKYIFNAFVIASNFSDSPTKQIEFMIKLKISGGATLTVGS